MALNTALKVAIHESGLKQNFIAREAGLSEPELSRIVNGRAEPTPDQKKAIAKALGRKVQDLFSEVAA